jgi:uncharacterized protein with GYD domain
MAKYLVTASYTSEGLKGLRKDGGTKRRQAAARAVESAGGTLESFYFAFGDQDAIVIADLPDASAAAALSIVIGSSGSVRTVTTPLITPEEMDKACQKKTAYKAPGT